MNIYYTVTRTPMKYAADGNTQLPAAEPEIRQHCSFKAWADSDGDNFTFEIDDKPVECYLYNFNLSSSGEWTIDVAEGDTDFVRYKVQIETA